MPDGIGDTRNNRRIGNFNQFIMKNLFSAIKLFCSIVFRKWDEGRIDIITAMKVVYILKFKKLHK
jgi:hypothetical protein